MSVRYSLIQTRLASYSLTLVFSDNGFVSALLNSLTVARHRRHQPIPAIRLAEQAMVHRIVSLQRLETPMPQKSSGPLSDIITALRHRYSGSASHAFVREPRQFVHGTLIAAAR